MPKIAMICNIPAPYREEVHIKLNQKYGNNYQVYYCAEIESNRFWKIKYGNYNKTFLKKSLIGKSSIYLNIDVIKSLNHFNPDVVLTGGFFPTMLIAFLWCKLHNKKHLVYTDGTLKSEEHLTFLHTLIRKLVYRFTDAYLGVSKKSLALYNSYNVTNEKLFISPYCANNNYCKQFRQTPKQYDLMFCGQFIERKMPFFFINTVKLVKALLPCKVVLVGDGNLKESMVKALKDNNIEYHYPGFIQAEELSSVYASSKVFLFPTKYDAWGLVANEACAVGVPVITCDAAGAANELVLHGYNGYVLPLDEKIWADHIVKLLSDNTLYKTFSDNAFSSVQRYNYDVAASGIVDAVNYSLNKNY